MAMYLDGEEVGIVNDVVETIEGSGGMSIKSEVLTADNAVTRIKEIIDNGNFYSLKCKWVKTGGSYYPYKLTINPSSETPVTYVRQSPQSFNKDYYDFMFSNYYKWNGSLIITNGNQQIAIVATSLQLSLTQKVTTSDSSIIIETSNIVTLNSLITNGTIELSIQYFE